MSVEVRDLAAQPVAQFGDVERGGTLALQQGDPEGHPILGGDVVSHASPK